MANDIAEITRALSAPLGEFIAAVGRGVAEAQQALDLHTLETFKTVYQSGESTYAEFRLLGYQPTWYRIPEVNAEIFVTLSASGREQSQRLPLPGEPAPRAQPALGGPAGETRTGELATADQAGGGRIQLYATPVDASYSNTYGYDIRACSQLKFRIVPVPPTTQAEGLKVVPALGRFKYSDAVAMLGQLNIPHRLADPYYEPKGDETIEATEPDAGSILLAGQVLVLKLAKAA